ncbi:hypothetical protein [Acrocarpospora sp. B8E8]|uniref:hypothetical protein n=1 Tax=Acrocarpospora sp. B8E8 TaxID=3153572 RepID=UPI00325F80E5
MQFWPFHRHRWREIERIGTVFTSWCPCGKTKTRVGEAVPERSRNVLPASPGSAGSHDHDPARSGVWDAIVRDVTVRDVTVRDVTVRDVTVRDVTVRDVTVRDVEGVRGREPESPVT